MHSAKRYRQEANPGPVLRGGPPAERQGSLEGDQATARERRWPL